MLSIIYPYRNRDLQRVKNSLNSLAMQNNRKFKVYFVDYGSSEVYSREVKNLCETFHFVKYSYCATQHQPWNKSRALNSIIKKMEGGYCFVADIDMIFHPTFIEKAIQLRQDKKTVYFQVGFLSPSDNLDNQKFTDFNNYRKSTSEATGLSMFPVKELQALRGFDEFYHFWGAEDTDMHIRLKNAGCEVEFYDENILLLHQWHPSYRSKESGRLTKELQVSGIVQLNHQHLKFTKGYKVTVVNKKSWGRVASQKEILKLLEAPVNIEVSNEKRQVDGLLFGQLPVINMRILKVIIRQDVIQKSPKYKLKKATGKKVPEFYSMKSVNDKVLLHLISFYRDNPYTYRVNEINAEIEFCIHL
ncbi:glycosyltransferase family 2 protein [Salegentibacter agarivorans]